MLVRVTKHYSQKSLTKVLPGRTKVPTKPPSVFGSTPVIFTYPNHIKILALTRKAKCHIKI